MKASKKETAGKKWSYAVSISFVVKKGGSKHSYTTQLYKIGVYCIFDNDPSQQASLKPNDLVSILKKIRADEKKGVVTNVKVGRMITVTTDADGFYCEAK